MPSWLQQVSPHYICVGEFECFASEDEELNQTQVDPPSPHESIPSKDSCQPILPFFFPFILSCWCFPSAAPGPALWCSASCWLRVLREGAEWPWGADTTAGACLHRAQHIEALAKEAPSPPHSGLSCRAFLAVPTKPASPSSAPLSDSM